MKTSTIQKMLNHAKTAMANAYAPHSNFQVGSCIRADDENFYSGCNIENASLSLTLCGETSAIANMITHGGKKIEEIVVVVNDEKTSTSCGACRQRICEFAANLDVKAHFFNNKDECKTMTVGQMLPDAFSL